MAKADQRKPYSGRLANKLQKLGRDTADGKIHTRDCWLITEYVLRYHRDFSEYLPPIVDEDKRERADTVAISTLENYVSNLCVYARYLRLHDTTPEELNRFSDKLRAGYGYHSTRSRRTIEQYQLRIRKFYRTFPQLGIRPEDVHVIDLSKEEKETKVRPEDMLSGEEIQRCLDANVGTRARAAFALLLYTGMRNTAARTLRWKDIDLQEGTWRFNDDLEEGLKDVYKPRSIRPLLYAKGYLAEWKKDHPDPDPDNYVLTGKKGHATPETPISPRSLRRMTADVKEAAEIDKPLYPHMCRHNFVTILKADLERDDGVVKFLIGHHPSSDVMETTYAHLSDMDYVRNVEVALGIREPDEKDTQNRFAAAGHCPACDFGPITNEFVVCPKCRSELDPEAALKERDARDAVFETKGQAAGRGDDEGEAAADAIYNFIEDNPDEVRELLSDALDDGPVDTKTD
jgi:integrase